MSRKRTLEEFASHNIYTTENFDKALEKLNAGLNLREIFKKTFKAHNVSFSPEIAIILKKIMKKRPEISSVQLHYSSFFENEDLGFILLNPNIKSLDLAMTHSQILGSDSFHKNLAINTTLQSLKLNCFSFRDGSFDGFVDALISNTTLTSFSMLSNPTSFQNSFKLFKAVINHPSIQFLRYELHCFPEMDDFYLQPVNLIFGDLISLDLSNSIFCEYVGTNLFHSLAQVTTLKTLIIRHSNLKFMTRQFAQYIRQTTVLEKLYMNYTELQEDCVPDVLDSMTVNQSIKIIELFRLGHYPSTLDYFYKFFKENDTVEEFTYECYQLSSLAVNNICNALEGNTTLRVLSLYPSSKISTKDHQAIHISHPLTSLLRVNSTLQKLSLGNLCFDDICISNARDALKYNTTLTELSLHNNLITDMGLTCIAEALCVNTTLTSLDLQRNQIKYHDTRFNDVLISNTRLLSLNLGENPFDMNGYSNIISALPFLQVLKKLTLSQKYVKGNAYDMTVNALMLNTSLVSLDIYETNEGPYFPDDYLEDLYQKRTLFDLIYFSLYSTYPL